MKTFYPYTVLLFLTILALTGNAQLVVVTGSINNEKTGNTIENVNIFESFSGIGTITNVSGFFSLMLKPGNAEFVITHAGFKDFSKKMVLSTDTTFTISIIPLVNQKTKSRDAEHQKTAEKTEKENK
jgi:hypothetical protein